MRRIERKLEEMKWAIFQRKRGDRIVQLDVVPSIDGRPACDHILGVSCNCHPYREWHPQNIPFYVHARRFTEPNNLNQMEDVMMSDPKYDPNQKVAEPKKDDETKKKKPGEEDEEEEETNKRPEKTPR